MIIDDNNPERQPSDAPDFLRWCVDNEVDYDGDNDDGAPLFQINEEDELRTAEQLYVIFKNENS